MIALPTEVRISCKCMNCLREHRDVVLPMEGWERTDGSVKGLGEERLYAASQRFPCPCGSVITVEYDVWEYPSGRIGLREYSCDGGWRLE